MNRERYYNHKLTQIEKGTLLDSLSGITTPGFNQETSPVSMVKDTKLLSLLQANASKVVDENCEPMVVWHSGAEGINAFSREFDKQGIGRQFWGKGFYLGTKTSKDEWSRRYEAKTGKKATEYPVFLNLRNPSNKAINGEISNTEYDGVILPPVRTIEGLLDFSRERRPS